MPLCRICLKGMNNPLIPFRDRILPDLCLGCDAFMNEGIDSVSVVRRLYDKYGIFDVLYHRSHHEYNLWLPRWERVGDDQWLAKSSFVHSVSPFSRREE